MSHLILQADEAYLADLTLDWFATRLFPGRLHAQAAHLVGDPARADQLIRSLDRLPGVLGTRVCPGSGRVTVRYDARKSDRARLQAALSQQVEGPPHPVSPS